MEFEDFLKQERRKGLSKTVVWTGILLFTTATIIVMVFSGIDAAVKYFVGM